MGRMTGNRYFAEAVHAAGTTHVFFVPTIMLPAMAEMEDMGIRRVVTHGEKAAAYMADGYARAARRPGFCLAQTIGSANLAAGLRDAYMACSPVIAITGGVDRGIALQARLPGDRRLPAVGVRHQGELPRRRARALPGPAPPGVPRRDQRRAGPGASRDGGHARPGPRARGRADAALGGALHAVPGVPSRARARRGARGRAGAGAGRAARSSSPAAA